MDTARLKTKTLSLIMALGMMGSLFIPHASAADYCKDRTGRIVKSAAIGAGVGVAAGALSKHSSILKGGLVGAGTGAAVGALDRSETLNNHPLARRVASGAAIGIGTNIVRDKSVVRGGLIGGAAGALFHLGRSRLSDDSGRPIPNCH